MATTNKLNFFVFLHIDPWSAAAFHLRMVGEQPCSRTIFSSERVNLGTPETHIFPMLLLTMTESLWAHIQEKPLPEHYLPARTVGILSGMAFIVVVFYTLNGILGRNYEILNIALYFAGVIYALRTENRSESKQMCINDYVAMTILAILAVAFFAFTNYPPELGIFTDPTAD